MTVNELVKKYAFRTLSLPDGDAEVRGAYIGDLLSWVMGRAENEQLWVTIMSNINIVAVAALSGVSAILLAEGVTVEDDVKEAAQARGINILSSDQTAYDLISRMSRDGAL